MLYIDKEKWYIVFPSWLQPAYKWEDLSEILSNPFEYDEFFKLTYGKEGLRELGFPEKPQAFELLAGSEGGGIIVVDLSQNRKWLGRGALTFDKGVDITSSRSGLPHDEWLKRNLNVSYLEDTHYIGWYYETGRKRRDFHISMIAEHVESAGDSVFWILGLNSIKPNKRETKFVNEIHVFAHQFGLEAIQLNDLPESVRNEMDWLSKSWMGKRFIYFDVNGGGDGFGYHFAVMTYVGLHLRSVIGRRIQSMFLISSIEGKPHPYSQCAKKSCEQNVPH